MQKKRGSAILIAVLLVAAIGSVAFSFGRILYLQVSNAALYENGVGAYYAAESGIEEGFLRYRYDRNTQVPDTNDVGRAMWTAGQNINRFDLTTATFDFEGLKSAGFNGSAGDQYFDLSMGAKTQTVNGDESRSEDMADITKPEYGTGDSPYFIARDSTKKIDLGDLFSTENQSIRLQLKPTNPVTSPNVLSKTKCTLFEIKMVGEKLDGVIEEKKAMLVNSDFGTCPYGGILSSSSTGTVIEYSPYQFNTSQDNLITIFELKSKIAPTVPYKKATLYIRPIGADAAYRLINYTSDIKYLDSPFTMISSTGHYGDTTRTLETKIDHQSGSLFDLYDYVLLQGNN